MLKSVSLPRVFHIFSANNSDDYLSLSYTRYHALYSHMPLLPSMIHAHNDVQLGKTRQTHSSAYIDMRFCLNQTMRACRLAQSKTRRSRFTLPNRGISVWCRMAKHHGSRRVRPPRPLGANIFPLTRRCRVSLPVLQRGEPVLMRPTLVT